MKIIKIIPLFIASVILLIQKVNSQSADQVTCLFKEKQVKISLLSVNTSYYTCSLNRKNLTYGTELVSITGQHEDSKTNDDVQYLSIIYFNNFLHTFSSIFCDTFENLKAVELRGLQLQSIDEDSLRNCSQLEYLWLVSNEFTEIPETLLDENKNLKAILIFYNNNLESLPENLLSNQSEVKYLSLHTNQLKELPPGVFAALGKLERLELVSNKIPAINPVWFENLENLKYLSLDNNLITEVPSKSFGSLRNLQSLGIGENKIMTLHSDSFVGLDSLKTLWMWKNQITDLPKDMFKPLKSLEMVTFAYNKLTTIHSDSFGDYPLPRRIFFNRNELVSIDPKSELTAASIRGNPCNGDRSDSSKWLENCYKNYKPRFLN